MHRNIVRSLAIVAVLVIGTVTANAAEITILIASPNGPPEELKYLPVGGIPTGMLSRADGSYHGQVPDPKPPSWLARYVIVGSWPDGNEQLYLRLTQSTPKNLTLQMFCKRPPATNATLDYLDTLGDDLVSLLERYSSGRYVYLHLPAAATGLKRRALRSWYDAAFLLARDYNFIDRDPQVMEKAKQSGDGYFVAMNKQLLSIDWGDVALVSNLVASGAIDEALQLNTFFLHRLASSNAEDVAAAALQGVTPTLLKKNDAYISTLARSSARTAVQ